MCLQFLPVVQSSSCFDFETAANLIRAKNSADKTFGYEKVHICLLPKLILNDLKHSNMQTTNEHINICLNCDKSDFYVSSLV